MSRGSPVAMTLLSDCPGQVEYLHAGIVQQEVDCGILLGPATDLSQHRCRNSNEGPMFVGQSKDGRGAPSQNSALCGVGQRGDSL
jgi:hypothetical protein